jgi:hypothetical protein
VKYELGFHIPEADILHRRIRGNLKSYIGRISLHRPVIIRGYTSGRRINLRVSLNVRVHKGKRSVREGETRV